MKKIRKCFMLFSFACMLSASLSACTFLDKLKGESSEEEIDKNAVYNEWMVDSGLSLDEMILSYPMKTDNGNISIQSGTYKKKGYDFFSLSKDNKDINVCILQGVYYLQTKDGIWMKTESLNGENEKLVKTLQNGFSSGLGNKIDIISSKYIKSDGNTDIVEVTVPDVASQKIKEAEIIKELRVVDEGEYGNGLAVVINDGNWSYIDEEEEFTMPVRVYVKEGTGDIKKIQYKINETVTEINTEQMEYKLPDGMENAEETDGEVWIKELMKEVSEMKEGVGNE